MFYDFGIMLIKPDGVAAGAENIIEDELFRKNISILCKRRKRLKKSEVKKNFYYKFSDYLDYMTSGDVIAYLICGQNMDLETEIFFIKSSVRKKFNVNGRMTKNIIHGAHCGTEYFTQRRLFFPEYERSFFSSFADPLVKADSIEIEHLECIEERIQKTSNIQKLIFCFEYAKIIEDIEKINYLINHKINFAFSHNVYFHGKAFNIFSFIPPGLLQKDLLLSEEKILTEKKVGIIRCIDANTHISNRGKLNCIEDYQRIIVEKHTVKVHNLLEELKSSNIEIRAMIVGKAGLTVEESEIRFEVAKLLNLIPVIGSYDETAIGLFGCSPNKFDQLLNLYHSV